MHVILDVHMQECALVVFAHLLRKQKLSDQPHLHSPA